MDEPIWDELDNISKSISGSELKKLSKDLSENLDKYIYEKKKETPWMLYLLFIFFSVLDLLLIIFFYLPT